MRVQRSSTPQENSYLPVPAQSDEFNVTALEITTEQQSDITTAELLAKSGFFPSYSEAAKAFAVIQAGRELNLGPFTSLKELYIVNTKLGMSAALAGALVKRSNRYDYRIVEHTNQSCSVEFFQNGKSIGVSTFTMNDAQTAGLLGKDVWKKYPRNMLFARALMNGCRWYCSDVFLGSVYDPEELEKG
jgi:hypothetical protein